MKFRFQTKVKPVHGREIEKIDITFNAKNWSEAANFVESTLLAGFSLTYQDLEPDNIITYAEKG